MLAVLLSIFTLLLHSSFVSVSYFILDVPCTSVRENIRAKFHISYSQNGSFFREVKLSLLSQKFCLSKNKSIIIIIIVTIVFVIVCANLYHSKGCS